MDIRPLSDDVGSRALGYKLAVSDRLQSGNKAWVGHFSKADTGTFWVAPKVEDVKRACSRESITFDNDIFNELAG